MKTSEILERADRCLKTRAAAHPELVVAQAHDVVIEDVEGREYVDFSCGNYHALGYCHPDVVNTVTETARNSDHVPLHLAINELVVEHAEKLRSLVPNLRNGKVAYACSGTESVEFAAKLAVGHTGRPILISYRGGHHGRGPKTLALTADIAGMKRGYPYMTNTVHVPFPYCYRCPFEHGPSACSLECFDYLRETFDTVVPPDSVAGILIEPIQGWNGYVVPPAEYMRRLDQLCRELGILLIDDEVLLNMGSTGKMLSIQHFNVEPNIVTLGKALGFGFPLSAIVASAEMIDKWPHGRGVSSAAANHLAISASIRGIQIIEQERLADNALRVGDYLRSEIAKICEKSRFVGEVRGKGLCVGIELVQDKDTKTPSPTIAERLVQLAFERRLLLGRTGTYRHVIRISPPLITTNEIAENAIRIISDLFDVLSRSSDLS